MEIISFVQDTRRTRSFGFPVFPKIRKTKNIKRNQRELKNRKNDSLIFSPTMYSAVTKSYSVQKINNPVTVKSVLIKIGRFVTDVEDFVVDNIKSIIISTLVLGVSFILVTTGFKIYEHCRDFTGPIKIETKDSSDIEYLNNLMSQFALENSSECDEQGFITDSNDENKAISLKTVYRQPVTYQNYKIKSGDTISGIAKKFGLTNISSLISVNDIGNVRQIAAGQKIKIPSYDGIIYTVKKGDTLDILVKKYNVKLETLLDVNELSSETLTVGQQLFLPGVGLDSKTLKTAMGDRFILPISAKFRWSSPYGTRIDPIAGVKSFHTGTDMACPTGTPILASMSGKVSYTGINRVYGNYVIIDHGNGYQTLYAHMSKIIATKGQWVSQGTRIGLVGSTGYSTGPHLHFTVYKNGKMIDPMSVLK